MGITIVGLGPGRIEDLTLAAWKVLENADEVYLRTARHPLVNDLPAATTYHSFDNIYDTAESFDVVYQIIAERIIDAAKRPEGVIYAVPGHPMVGEKTTSLIIEAARQHGIGVDIIDGLSFVEPSLRSLKLDGMSGLQIQDALDVMALYHPSINPDFPVLIAQVYSRDVASNLKLTLMNQYPDEYAVVLLHNVGTQHEIIERLPLYEIDRSEHIAHMTTLFVPASPQLSSFEALQNVMAHLRSEVGCPWDREQTRESLRPQILEEIHELLEAIDTEDIDGLREELGDALFHMVFQAQLATEDGDFYMTDVLQTVISKLIRRHPHVWGDLSVDGAGEVLQNWEAIKKQEQAEKAAQGQKARESRLDGVPMTMPALGIAYRLQERAAAVGFDWDEINPVIEKVLEEIDEVKVEPTSEEFGDLLFAVVNWSRWQKIDAESALREANAKFKRRFKFVEQRAAESGQQMQDMSLEALDAFWNEAKANGL